MTQFWLNVLICHCYKFFFQQVFSLRWQFFLDDAVIFVIFMYFFCGHMTHKLSITLKLQLFVSTFSSFQCLCLLSLHFSVCLYLLSPCCSVHLIIQIGFLVIIGSWLDCTDSAWHCSDLDYRYLVIKIPIHISQHPWRLHVTGFLPVHEWD